MACAQVQICVCTHLEVGQGAGLGTQRLGILICLRPLDRFVRRKLEERQTSKKEVIKAFVCHMHESSYSYVRLYACEFVPN
jgi:hypothetical protein